jgi:simple sugar transport system permease protein
VSTDTLEKPTASEPTPPVEETLRAPRSDTWLVTVLAIFSALVLGGLLIIFSDETVRHDMSYFFQHPSDTFRDAWYTVRDAYKALFQGSIYNFNNDGTKKGIFGPITATIFTATPLICAGLGISLAFRAGLFNIGGQGQVIAGAMASGYVGFAWTMPPVIHLIVAVVAGVVAGGFWGFIAGFLKARTGANEVITTIMLNYVALNVLHYLLSVSGVIAGPGAQASKIIHGNARLPVLFGAQLQVNLGIILALAAAVFVWWLMGRSTLGFRLRAVGANPAAARTAGMSVSAVTMMAMALAGALAGLGGTALALGGATSYQVTPSIDSNVGFDAITVALLGRTSPWGTVWAGLLLGALRQGGATMQATTSVPIDIVTVIQAFIVIFIAAPRLIRAVFRLRIRGRAVLTGAATNLTVTVTTLRQARVPRHVLAGVTEIVIGVLSLWLFGLGTRSTLKTTFEFSLPGAKYDLGSWTFTARPAVVVLSILVILAGVLRLTRWLAARWCASIAILGAVLSFMIWSVAGTTTGLNIVSLLQGALFPAAIPLILGALAGVIGERAGVVNVAIEGQLLLGAFLGAFIASISGSVWGGLFGGIAAGVLLAAVLAVMSIRYLVDQVIVGVVLNLFATGITSFLFIELMTPHADEFNTPGYLAVWKVPFLGDIPIIGPVFFDGTVLLYVTYVLIAAVHFGLFHTRWGLRLRSVGEHPRAADTVGIKVLRTRYRAVLLAGVVAGLGGAFLVLGSGAAGTFQLNMSAGKGFIALACVIFGRWTPTGAVLAALLFGFADQLQSLLQGAGTPIDSNLLVTLPYVVTIFAVAGFVGRVRAPAADGQPYIVG